MSDDNTLEPPSEHTEAPVDRWSEFVVRHIPLLPLFALLIILGNFAIFFDVFRLGLE